MYCAQIGGCKKSSKSNTKTHKFKSGLVRRGLISSLPKVPIDFIETGKPVDLILCLTPWGLAFPIGMSLLFPLKKYCVTVTLPAGQL